MISSANFGEYNRNVKKPVEELEKASESKLLRLFENESKKRLKQQLGAFRLGGRFTNVKDSMIIHHGIFKSKEVYPATVVF